jgi:uncharacterized membrane protein YiaA
MKRSQKFRKLAWRLLLLGFFIMLVGFGSNSMYVALGGLLTIWVPGLICMVISTVISDSKRQEPVQEKQE